MGGGECGDLSTPLRFGRDDERLGAAEKVGGWPVKQIPCGDDNKKSNSNSNGNSDSNSNSNGNSNSKGTVVSRAFGVSGLGAAFRWSSRR